MHSFIYFGFLVLFIATVVLEIDHQLPDNLKFLHGGVYQGYAFAADLVGVVFIVGIVWAIARRYVERPVPHPHQDQARGRGHPRHVPRDRASPASSPRRCASRCVGPPRLREVVVRRVPALVAVRRLVGRATLDRRAPRGCGASHFAAFVAFLVILPTTKLRHMITSPMNMYLKRQGPAQGRDEAHAEPHGDRARDVRRVDDRGLHLEAALRHRRVHDLRALHVGVPGARHRQAARPARDRAEGRRGDGRHRRPGRCRRRSASTRDITITADSVFERITSEELWACTSCKACDEICPVNIEILDKILDMRRYLSLMESDFPAELGNTYRSMENSSNVYGMNQGERGDWAAELEGVEIVDAGSGAARPRVPLLGRVRGLVRRPQQEDEPRRRQAAAARRHRLRDPRPERAVHRRPGPPLGQRVHLPDAGDAEHRDARRPRRAEDHHAVPALLQHAEERVPAARRQLRGRAPLAAAERSSSPTAASRSRARRSTSGSRTTTPATSAATTTCTSRRARSSARSAASTSSRCRATAPRACAAAPAARACGWRSTSARR